MMKKTLFIIVGIMFVFSACSHDAKVSHSKDTKYFTHVKQAKAKERRLVSQIATSSTARQLQMPQHFSRPVIKPNTERYDLIKDNAFKSTKVTPLSTLSIDVDTASYTNILRMIEDEDKMPVKGAVRIEEMINYFTYDYPQPKAKAKHPLTITTEVAQAPWHKKNRLLLVGLQAKKIPKEKLPASNFVALIDVSGSMRYDLPLVKKTLKILAKKLDKNDRLSIVNYATNIGVTLEPTLGDQYETIAKAVDTLVSYGGTDGASGIDVAYALARKSFIAKGNNRILMFTDGDFNVGRTSASEMVSIVEKERESGVFLSIVGFGRGNYNDSMMEKMADNGNGNYSYVHDLLDAKKTFDSELVGTLYTLGKDVKFQLEFNPAKVDAYRLIGYENRVLNAEDFNDDSKDAGEIGVGHSVTVLYELVMHDDTQSKQVNIDPLKYQKTELKEESEEIVTIKMRYKKPDGVKSTLISQSVEQDALATDNIRFASAVAGFGMILRDSKYKGAWTYADAIKEAKRGKGKDDEGYRAAFIKLVQKCELIDNK